MRNDILHVPAPDATMDVDAARRLLPTVRLLERRIARIRLTPAWLRHRGGETPSLDMVSVHRTRRLPLLPMVAVAVDEEPARCITDLSDGGHGITIVNRGQTVGLSTDPRTRIDFAHNVVGYARRALEVLASGIPCPTADDMDRVVRNISRLVVEAHPELREEHLQILSANNWTGFRVKTPFGSTTSQNIASRISSHQNDEAHFEHWSIHPKLAYLTLNLTGNAIIVGRPQHMRPARHEDGIGALRDAATDAHIAPIVAAIRRRYGVT